MAALPLEAQAIGLGALPLLPICAISLPMVGKRKWPIGCVAAVGLAVTVGGCTPPTNGELDHENQVDPSKPKPVLPIAEPPVNRARLLLAVVRAASSHASGFDDSDAQRLLDGKQFKFRMRFGCESTSSSGLPLTWSQDSDGRTLRFAASSNLSLDDKEMQLLAPPGITAAEGFWLDRPWMLAAACPATEADVGSSTEVEADIGEEEGGRTSDPAEPSQRIGIAQFLASENDTAHRRLAGPYEAVVKLEQGRLPSKEGYDFVMAGRLRALGNGRVIMCAGDGRDRPPDCVVSVNIDRAWIEMPGDGHVLAQWGN